jgi:DNA-directed RNA polymerase subunit RPC12/RpoP
MNFHCLDCKISSIVTWPEGQRSFSAKAFHCPACGSTRLMLGRLQEGVW